MNGNMVLGEHPGTSGSALGSWRLYVPGLGIDDRIAMVDMTGSTATSVHYYAANRIGSVIGMVNTAGVLTDQYLYSPYGVEEPLAGSGNPFRYTGRYYDGETGLYYYRKRSYSAPEGRFTGPDALLYADQWNTYAYVGNNPINNVDPSGQECVTQADGSGLCDPPGDDIGTFTIPAEHNPGHIGPDRGGYHKYGAETSTPDSNGSLKGVIADEVIANPTPGKDTPATPEGVVNDAGISPPLPGDDKVISYVTSDSNGNTVVVNVTVPGAHGLNPGYVAQAIIPSASSTSIVVVGEGNAYIQVGPGSAIGGAVFQNKINRDMRRAIYKSTQ